MKVILPIENTKNCDPDFSKKPDKFKCLYLLHGFSGNENTWIYSSNIFKIARDNNLAIVMPAGENGFYLDQSDRGLLYKSYIGEELIRATRRMFPISDKREDTFIGGLSMGAFGALYIGSSFPETFSKIICLSGPYDRDDPILGMIAKEKHLSMDNYFNCIETKDPLTLALKMHAENRLGKIYMACGRQDFLYNSGKNAYKKLKDAGTDILWSEADGLHEFSFWNPEITKAIDWCLNE
jgi:S-formylglutathione hydrolase FrmB